jgi:hypothetical protein
MVPIGPLGRLGAERNEEGRGPGADWGPESEPEVDLESDPKWTRRRSRNRTRKWTGIAKGRRDGALGGIGDECHS